MVFGLSPHYEVLPLLRVGVEEQEKTSAGFSSLLQHHLLGLVCTRGETGCLC